MRTWADGRIKVQVEFSKDEGLAIVGMAKELGNGCSADFIKSCVTQWCRAMLEAAKEEQKKIHSGEKLDKKKLMNEALGLSGPENPEVILRPNQIMPVDPNRVTVVEDASGNIKVL
jgi:hypothetical protein